VSESPNRRCKSQSFETASKKSKFRQFFTASQPPTPDFDAPSRPIDHFIASQQPEEMKHWSDKSWKHFSKNLWNGTQGCLPYGNALFGKSSPITCRHQSPEASRAQEQHVHRILFRQHGGDHALLHAPHPTDGSR